MSIVSNTGWALVLKAIGGWALTQVSGGNVYMSLHNASPGTTDTSAWNCEAINGTGLTGYARQPIVASGSGWTVSAPNMNNVSAIVFTITISSTAYTVSNWGLWDHVSNHGGTDYWMGGGLTASAVFNASGTLTFAAGSGLQISGT